jgi:TRAP-type mannitol/chloroaromatic compound transport system permease small subunit
MKNQRLEKFIRILWICFFVIPITIVISFTILSQFQSIEIEGKGDSGHERSIQYPFICFSSSSFVDTPTKYYCDSEKFFLQKYNQLDWIFNETGITTFYLILIIVLVPTTIISFKVNKKKVS